MPMYRGLVRPTVELGRFETAQAANDVVKILRANGIECSVEATSLPPQTVPGFYGGTVGHWNWHSVFVAKDDKLRARESLQGVFASEWFLRTPDGHPYHSFEAATVDILRAHAAGLADDEGFGRLDINHIADTMEQHGWHTVWQAFHEGRIRHHDRKLDGLTLHEWARRCGCAHLRESE
jgi:hypothetical protein